MNPECQDQNPEFKYQIVIEPLGLMYGSSGGFLSPENLVGRSSAKFPPDAATVAGIYFNVARDKPELDKREKLYVAGPFWGEVSPRKHHLKQVYLPIPWSLVIASEDTDRWRIEYRDGEPQWQRDPNKEDLEHELTWQPVETWNHSSLDCIREEAKKPPWRYSPILHPKMRSEQRAVVPEDGLFLENAVEMEPETCLVYLSTESLEPGWYRFGGENHLVEINCIELKGKFLELLEQPIERAFALIAPGVWGSNRFSYRYPQKWEFGEPIMMLTEKPIPYRYYTSGSLGRGRYAVPPGSVYVFQQPIGKPWRKWDKSWFPKEGLSLKRFGCGLCLPIEIPGL